MHHVNKHTDEVPPGAGPSVTRWACTKVVPRASEHIENRGCCVIQARTEMMFADNAAACRWRSKPSAPN